MEGSASRRITSNAAVPRDQVVEPEIVDVNEVVKRFQVFRGRAAGAVVRVEVDLDPDVRPVRVAAGSLDRILMNLAVNALRATSHGGSLSITTENVSIGEFSHQHRSVLANNYVCITVRCSGQRMPKDVINRILEPLFTTTPGDEGTELGLPTVYGIVTRALRIQVQTELGGGTSFRIFLPAAESAPMPTSQGERGCALPTRKLVLVVEQAVAMRRLISRALTSAGYEVKSAPRPAKALELLDRLDRPVDVLIVDVVMPGLGKLLGDRVSGRYPNVKILYMSGDPDQVESPERVEPRSQYLQKPFTKDELVGKVNSLVTDSIAV